MALIAVAFGSLAHGQTRGFVGFDGADQFLSGFDPVTENQDDGPGNFFGVGSIGSWPQAAGLPFSLADDSVVGVSGSPFSGDTEGVFGQAASTTNNFFAISDTRDLFGRLGTEPSASWTFDVSGAPQLEFSVDLGQLSDGDASGGFSDIDFIRFEGSFDGGPSFTILEFGGITAPAGFTYRAMDSDVVPAANGVLGVTGGSNVRKLIPGTGMFSNFLVADKTPANGPGAGVLDRFYADILGTGNTLTVTMQTLIDFEAAAFDNLTVNAIPEPSAMVVVLGLFGGLALRRRCRG